MCVCVRVSILLSKTAVSLTHALCRTNLICNRKDDFPKYAQTYHYASLRHNFMFMLSKIKFSLLDNY